jgi:hypothetical protein
MQPSASQVTSQQAGASTCTMQPSASQVTSQQARASSCTMQPSAHRKLRVSRLVLLHAPSSLQCIPGYESAAGVFPAPYSVSKDTTRWLRHCSSMSKRIQPTLMHLVPIQHPPVCCSHNACTFGASSSLQSHIGHLVVIGSILLAFCALRIDRQEGLMCL